MPLLADHARPVPKKYRLAPSLQELKDERDRLQREYVAAFNDVRSAERRGDRWALPRLEAGMHAANAHLEAVLDDIAALTQGEQPTQEPIR